VNEAVFSDHSMVTPELNELKKVQGPEKTSKSYL